MNLMCFYKQAICKLENSGVMAIVTFMRINAEKSEPIDPFFNEREKKKKTYDEYIRKAQIEENPKQNIVGPGGGEKIADLRILLYDLSFYPKYSDLVKWAGEQYEITEIERINPFGDGQQVGLDILATKFS